MNAVDTNVYVYTFDADEPVKRAKAIELLNRLSTRPAETVTLWQVAGELLNQLRNWELRGRLTAAEVEAAFNRVRALFELQIPSESMFPIYFGMRSRFSLSHWDSMLLAACKEAGVTTLFSEDMDAGTDYDGLIIVNPFA